MLRRYIVLLIVVFLGLSMRTSAQEDVNDLVNLDHLRFLTQQVNVNNQQMSIVHIYSESPEYEWVDAAGEGLSAVDDVARAAIVYLWQYERTGDAELLDLARDALEFVLYMQAEDGEFYNFVFDADGTINETGNTSYKSLGWWAMRGLWALGEGVRVFNSIDSAYADRLAQAYQRTETALGATLSNYGEMTTVHGFDIPAWIPGGEPAVASIGLLGLAAYYEARPNEVTADIITRIADGVSLYHLGDHSTYPFGMHPVRANAPGYWHDWGAHMTHALVMAGIALDRQDWIDSAAAEADSFMLRHLAFERFRQIGVIPNRLEQIAYGTNMLVQTYMALYRATDEERFARYGGVAASWYFGNNMAGEQMYFPESGRVYDGINGPSSFRINRNSGAESTIEGLMSMIAVADVPIARDLIHVTPLEGNRYTILQAEDGQRINGTPVYFSADWTGEGNVSAGRYVGLGEGQRMRLVFDVEQPDDYLLYVAQMHQSMNDNAFTLQRVDTAPVLDGNLSDWSSDLPVLESNTQGQFLRGAGIWQGADVDSHAIRLAWDDEYLYIHATVRDPELVQPYSLSTVWQGDTLWFYMTNNPLARTLSAKFTFAQTPDGPQIWDWVNTRFLRDAEMAFAEMDGGYMYEGRVPWESIGVENPTAGTVIGLEVGRGIGGNSFMDLSGRDPDVTSNLLQITLIDENTPADSLTSPDVFLDIRLDDFDSVTLPQTVSPDNDYFWLDLVSSEPLRLEMGEHTIRYRYEGQSAENMTNPGLAKVDAFFLQPVAARRVFQHPDGRIITLTYNTLTGEAIWIEE